MKDLLTAKRKRILILAANGHTTVSIAREMNVGLSTVKSQMKWIFDRLGARDRCNAIAIALALGVIRREEIHIPSAVKKF